MKKIILITIAVIAFIGILVFWQIQSVGREQQFQNLYPTIEMNQKLKLVVLDDSYNSFKANEDLALELQNISTDKVEFRPSSGVKIYIYHKDSQSWLEVPNDMNYVPSDVHPLLEPQTTPGFLFSVSPMVSPSKIRVVAVGQISKNGQPSGENIGAYVDVTLQ